MVEVKKQLMALFLSTLLTFMWLDFDDWIKILSLIVLIIVSFFKVLTYIETRKKERVQRMIEEQKLGEYLEEKMKKKNNE